jgi:hypothetical protein
MHQAGVGLVVRQESLHAPVYESTPMHFVTSALVVQSLMKKDGF